VRERTRKHRSDGGTVLPQTREPSISEMLSEPIVRAVMAADGVRAGELKALLRSAAKRLAARGTDPLAKRGG
jgi:hypothetical protein